MLTRPSIGMSIVSILEKTDRATTAPHCSVLNLILTQSSIFALYITCIPHHGVIIVELFPCHVYATVNKSYPVFPDLTLLNTSINSKCVQNVLTRCVLVTSYGDRDLGQN